jgi:hypothetical protein
MSTDSKEKNEYVDTDIIEVDFTETLVGSDQSNLPSTSVREVKIDPSVMDDIDVEFYYARNNLINILESSKDVLESAAELAVETGHPRMVEVYSGLVKNLADVNKSLFDIREKKMKMQGDMEPDDSPTVVNNNSIFVGSTDDLLEMMKKKQNKSTGNNS